MINPSTGACIEVRYYYLQYNLLKVYFKITILNSTILKMYIYLYITTENTIYIQNQHYYLLVTMKNIFNSLCLLRN